MVALPSANFRNPLLLSRFTLEQFGKRCASVCGMTALLVLSSVGGHSSSCWFFSKPWFENRESVARVGSIYAEREA
jgi:hypothetical protein